MVCSGSYSCSLPLVWARKVQNLRSFLAANWGLFLLQFNAELWYLLLWIPFVLIITINDWFGYLNASFRETSLLCHCYKWLPKLSFTQGSHIPSFIFFCPRDVVLLSSKQYAGRAIVITAKMSTCTHKKRESFCCLLLDWVSPPPPGEQKKFLPHLYLIKLFSATNYNHALLKIITNSCNDYRMWKNLLPACFSNLHHWFCREEF